MPFVDKSEFVTIISMAALDSLTGSDDVIINTMVEVAVEEMKAQLCGRYNVDNIFNATGDDRSKMAMMLVKDIALYHLFSRHHLKPMPEIRVKRYAAAMQWLTDVAEQKINPTRFTLLTTPIVKTGGNEKRTNHQL